MRFLPEPPRGLRRREVRWLGWLLLGACALTAATTAWPWLRVGLLPFAGEAGWRTRTGFTCLLTCVLLALLTLVETGTRSAREAVRPASAFVAAITAFFLAGDILDGPGALRGNAASWTAWFWAGVAGFGTVSLLCWRRLASRLGPPRLDGGRAGLRGSDA